MSQTLTATQPHENIALKKRYTFKEVLSAANLVGYKIYPLYHSQQGYGLDILEGWEAPKNMISGFLTLVTGYSWIINNPASRIDSTPHLDRQSEAPSDQQTTQTEQPTSQKITTTECDQTTVVCANDIAIASIVYNDSGTGNYITHPWVVMIGDNEIHNCSTWQQAYSYITWHHKQNTLLDKPFDELTCQEWYDLKNGEPPTDTDQIETTLRQTEIDTIPDQHFGELCRLWHGRTLLGTYYRKLFTDNWVATPADSIHPYHCPTEDDAMYWLVAHHHQHSTPKPNNRTLIAKSLVCASLLLMFFTQSLHAVEVKHVHVDQPTTDDTFRGDGRRELK